MQRIGLIGFPDRGMELLQQALGGLDCHISPARGVDELPEPIEAVFVWGEHENWLETILRIRAAHKRTLIIIVTAVPDYSKWFDALEAGASDYCCLPAKSLALNWMFRPDAHFRSTQRSTARRAAAGF